MSITEEDIRDILDAMHSRIAEVKAIGGVALLDVVNGTARVPDGWVLDVMTQFYVPEWWLNLDGQKAVG